jgi:ATP-dependent DNA helicase RecG
LLNLNTSLQYLKGVGPARYKILEELGLKTVKDLIYYFPRNWIDRRILKKIKELKIGDKVTLYATVLDTEIIFTRNNMKIFKAVLSDGSSNINAYWFRHFSRKYDVLAPLKKNITRGANVFISGDLDWEGIKVTEYEFGEDINELIHTGRIVPIYNATENVNSKFLRAMIKQALEQTINEVEEFFPREFLDKNYLSDLKWCLKNIHFPESWDAKERAYYRLAFEEFFLMQLALLGERENLTKIKKNYNYTLTKKLLTPFKNNLNFEFTNDQKKTINEIFNDLMSEHPMNRLLQGDVGSGKTIVALSAMLLAIENKYQTILMAPTEVLAEQHYLSTLNFTKGLNIRIGLLTGSLRVSQKKKIKEEVLRGEIDILIGTHAILDDSFNMPNLRLAVIDEQHRFGVNQRFDIRKKSSECDVLVMTATPIPRTLALTVYSDLDVSTIKEKPKGRKKIKTYISSQGEALEFLKKEIQKGRQGYIVYPAVDEKNKLSLKAAEAMYLKLKDSFFKDIPIGLIHGKMKVEEKNKVMKAFANNEIKVLVATTVIEVGIDVSNSTVIIIEDAERFGMATLHQLRGRVGRGSEDSYCFLVSDKKHEYARKRLESIVSYDDGFKIAEQDLIFRGPGDFLGTEQHGFLQLLIGDLINDRAIIEHAKREVENILHEDKYLMKSEYKKIKDVLNQKYKNKLELLKVG